MQYGKGRKFARRKNHPFSVPVFGGTVSARGGAAEVRGIDLDGLGVGNRVRPTREHEMRDLPDLLVDLPNVIVVQSPTVIQRQQLTFSSKHIRKRV